MFTFANIFFALPDLPNLVLILNLDKKVISQKFPNTTFCVPNSNWHLLKLLWEAKKLWCWNLFKNQFQTSLFSWIDFSMARLEKVSKNLFNSSERIFVPAANPQLNRIGSWTFRLDSVFRNLKSLVQLLSTTFSWSRLGKRIAFWL